MENPKAQPQTQGDVVVVVVPFPAQGHLNQLLHFSLLLATHHRLIVHYAAPATHASQAQARLQGWDSSALRSLHFHHLPLPPVPSPPPNPDAPVKFPAHNQPLFEAAIKGIRAPLARLLRSLSSACRRLVVVHDPLLSAVTTIEAARLPNAEAYTFLCLPALFSLTERWDIEGKLAAAYFRDRGMALPSMDGCATEEFLAFLRRVGYRGSNVDSAGTIINSCRPIEGEFIDLLAREPNHVGKRLFVVGPLNPLVITKQGGDHLQPQHECLEWLDKQPIDSVMYVSFGTTIAMSDDQIEQLAIGLQNSGQRFIWVLRDADRNDIYTASTEEGRKIQLPPGFDRTVMGARRGVVIRGWAPQLEILAHPSTGGFMSHCGWNSCIESLSMGVPIAAWPMHSDQPRNAMMVAEYLKVGIVMREWDHREEIMLAGEIEECIKRVMVHEEGREMRRRAKALEEAIRGAVSEGGSSSTDLNAFVAHIMRWG